MLLNCWWTFWRNRPCVWPVQSTRNLENIRRLQTLELWTSAGTSCRLPAQVWRHQVEFCALWQTAFLITVDRLLWKHAALMKTQSAAWNDCEESCWLLMEGNKRKKRACCSQQIHILITSTLISRENVNNDGISIWKYNSDVGFCDIRRILYFKILWLRFVCTCGSTVMHASPPARFGIPPWKGCCLILGACIWTNMCGPATELWIMYHAKRLGVVVALSLHTSLKK